MELDSSFFSTFRRLRQLPLDVRTATLGISIAGCSDRSLHTFCEGVFRRITQTAARFAQTCGEVSAQFGIPVLQRRLCVTPIDRVAHGFSAEQLVDVAKTLDGAAGHVRVDRIGGFAADVKHGLTSGARQLIAALPQALYQTERVRAAVHVGDSDYGINLDALSLVASSIRQLADISAHRFGDSAAKLIVLANDATGHPHLTGACLGDGWGDLVLHVGVGAAAIVRHALINALEQSPRVTLHELAAEIRTAAFQAARAAELIGRELSRRLGAEFGAVDLTLAPTSRPGDSVVDLLPLLGVERLGAPGSAAALALILGAMRIGGAFGSGSTGPDLRICLSVLEDPALTAATQSGELTLDQLTILAGAGSGGLDLVPLPGDIDVSTLAAILADHVSLAMVQRRAAAIRLIPVPGKKAGEFVSYSSTLGEAAIMDVPGRMLAKQFIERGGRIPPVR